MGVLELLQPFCATDEDVREYIHAPFRIGGYIYATNGAIAVRVRDDGTIVQEASQKLISLASMFEFAHINIEPSKCLPIPDLPAPIKCEDCAGAGFFFTIDCRDCGGKGWCSRGDNDYDCKECGGDGEIRIDEARGKKTHCLSCHGSGYVDGPAIPLGSSQFSRRLLALILGLPGVPLVRPDGNNSAAFIFEGGEGIIMPMRK